MLKNSIKVIGRATLPILFVLSFTGCFGGGGDDSAAPVAKVLFVNNGVEAIVSVIGESSVGTTESFVLTSTSADDATPNIIEKGEVGVVEITECDALWELSYSVSISNDPSDNIVLVQEMQLYSCDTEYELTCETQTFDYFGQPITVTRCMLKQ